MGCVEYWEKKLGKAGEGELVSFLLYSYRYMLVCSVLNLLVVGLVTFAVCKLFPLEVWNPYASFVPKELR